MRKLIAFMIIVLLAVTGIGYCFNVTNLKLQSDILELKTRIDTLNSSINDLESLIGDLNSSVNGLLDFYEKVKEERDSLIKYFFIQGSDFAIPLNDNVWWGVEAWNNISGDSICEIKNGALHLFYNGTIDYEYGNIGVFQGRHADGRFTHQLLVGSSPDDAFYGDYAIFPKSIESGKLRLETRFKIIEVGFNRYPVVYHPNYSRVNLGITLMCAINNEPFNLTAQTLWLDVYFTGYCLNKTHTWVVPRNWSYVAYPDDIHAGFFVEEVDPQDFGKWIEMSIDLGDYISRTLNLITRVDIKTIRVYGFIVFVECLGAYAEVEYDYVKTTRI